MENVVVICSASTTINLLRIILILYYITHFEMKTFFIHKIIQLYQTETYFKKPLSKNGYISELTRLKETQYTSQIASLNLINFYNMTIEKYVSIMITCRDDSDDQLVFKIYISSPFSAVESRQTIVVV